MSSLLLSRLWRIFPPLCASLEGLLIIQSWGFSRNNWMRSLEWKMFWKILNVIISGFRQLALYTPLDHFIELVYWCRVSGFVGYFYDITWMFLCLGCHQCRVHPQTEVSAAESLQPSGGVWGSVVHVGALVPQQQPGWVNDYTQSYAISMINTGFIITRMYMHATHYNGYSASQIKWQMFWPEMSWTTPVWETASASPPVTHLCLLLR